jgi:hypothetical protein
MRMGQRRTRAKWLSAQWRGTCYLLLGMDRLDMKKLKFAWKYRRYLWKYRKLIARRKAIATGLAMAATAVGTALLLHEASTRIAASDNT